MRSVTCSPASRRAPLHEADDVARRSLGLELGGGLEIKGDYPDLSGKRPARGRVGRPQAEVELARQELDAAHLHRVVGKARPVSFAGSCDDLLGAGPEARAESGGKDVEHRLGELTDCVESLTCCTFSSSAMRSA